MNKQTHPLHPPTRITLAVEGRFPGFPPDTIKVEQRLGTFELSRGGVKLASGQLAVPSNTVPPNTPEEPRDA